MANSTLSAHHFVDGYASDALRQLVGTTASKMHDKGALSRPQPAVDTAVCTTNASAFPVEWPIYLTTDSSMQVNRGMQLPLSYAIPNAVLHDMLGSVQMPVRRRGESINT